MNAVVVENDPWLNGWLAGKYGDAVPLPVDEGAGFGEWIAGFETGCVEVAEHHIWRLRLGEYLVKIVGGIYAQVADFVL
jgi:hypothetical protein